MSSSQCRKRAALSWRTVSMYLCARSQSEDLFTEHAVGLGRRLEWARRQRRSRLSGSDG
jgi:hypothetical protein